MCIGHTYTTAAIESSAGEQLKRERAHLLESLLSAGFRLQQAAAGQTNFLARALHDLRAPLTAVNGYCSILMGGSLGSLSPAQAEVVGRMQRSVQRLARIAQGMFELSLDRSGHCDPLFEPIDIEDCIAQAIHEVLPAAHAGEIEIKKRIDSVPATLLCDLSQMEQMLVNLLENACRFTPRLGSIEIEGYAVRWPVPAFHEKTSGGAWYTPLSGKVALNAYRIDIHDSGPEIPAAQLESIFEEGLSYSRGDDRSGTGLGLAISRFIVAAHHGSIFAASSSNGVTFSFVLPLTEVDLQLASGAGAPLPEVTSHDFPAWTDPRCSILEK